MGSQIFFQCINIMFEFFYYILFYFKSEQNISFENFVNNPCFHLVYIYIHVYIHTYLFYIYIACETDEPIRRNSLTIFLLGGGINLTPL